ncbi:MAG TPA: hypothetical protein PKN99_04035 [Cyclobacteriaceae bacterium]|jgi:hypothetical protein|nr:hypothetical protein [Cyclobacteriaceae bacterium]HRK53094.1 hypothetical protein [Cyclobacteriaceae bacterium]
MKVLFVIATTFLGGFIGLFYGIATVPKNSGLAGPAEVLGYAIVMASVSLVLSFIINRKVKPEIRKKITITFLLICLIPICWLFYRFKTNKSTDAELSSTKKPVTPISYSQEPTAALGLGMMRPDFYSKRVLYFYNSPNLEKSVSDHTPSDSLVFDQSDHHQYDITYAPPWFFPAHINMGYEILYMKVILQGKDWMQVEVNKQTGQLTWVNANEVKLFYWPQFLLSVNSIEKPDLQNNPLKVLPLEQAELWKGATFDWMIPVLVNENWLKVSLRDKDMRTVGEAWLLWRRDKNLLIKYSLLS